MSETLPLANVKSKFPEMVDRVEHTHDRIIVTRNPHRLGGELQRELAGLRSARRGV